MHVHPSTLELASESKMLNKVVKISQALESISGHTWIALPYHSTEETSKECFPFVRPMRQDLRNDYIGLLR
jgi:hypothetical protein